MEGTLQQMQNLSLSGQLAEDQRDKQVIDQQQDVGESLVLDNIDQAIQNALNYPQQRLTVIRLETEIEKFACDSNSNLYSFDTKLTNYERMLAHKIAQYWGMQTRSAEYTDQGPGAVQAVKPTQLKLPQVKLANLKPITSDPTSMSNPTKVLVRKQPMINNQHFIRPNPMNMNSNLMSKPPPPQFDYRSVQEREEDYNRARERIFLQEEQKLNAAQNQQIDNEVQSQQSNNSAGNIMYVQQGNSMEPNQQTKINNLNGAPILDAQAQNPMSNQLGNNDLSSGSLNQQAQQQQMTMINSSGNLSQGSSQTGNNNRKNRKAVFRNKEQELQDPDYRRGIERFMPRFAPNYEEAQKQGFYIMPTYGSEFPTLGPQSYMPFNPQFMPQQQALNPHQQNPMLNQQGGPMHPQAQGFMPHPQILQQQQLQVQHQNPHQQHVSQHPMQQPQLVPVQQMHMYPPVQGHQGQQQQQYPQQAFIQPIPMYAHQMQHNPTQQQLPQMNQQQFQQAHSGSTDSQQPTPQMNHPQMQPQMYFYPPQNAQMPPGLQFVNPQQFPMDFNLMQQNPHLANQFMMAQQQPGSRGGSVSGRNSNHGSSHRSSYKPNHPHNRNNMQFQQFNQQQQQAQIQMQRQQSVQASDKGPENRSKNGDKQPTTYAVDQIQNTNNKGNIDGRVNVDQKVQEFQDKIQNNVGSQQQDGNQIE